MMNPVCMQRREFLAGAAAASLILPHTVFGANKKLNVGFIGMGGVMGGGCAKSATTETQRGGFL